MYFVTFEADYTNISFGRGGTGGPYGHVKALIRVQVSGSVPDEGHRGYTPAEAIQAAGVLLKGLRVRCASVSQELHGEVDKEGKADALHEALWNTEVTLEPTSRNPKVAQPS